jgi:stage V sporulation protein R
MSQPWTIDDLQAWDERIQAVSADFGLDWFDQQFTLCDHVEMLGAMAYSGMPAHYPHWSYGKAFEKQKTLYDYGVSGLPYEMVINSNPSIGYLMSENTLCLQILTIAHVYGHNDFFKNNFTFRHTRPDDRLARVKLNAERVRKYIEDPSIGIDAVEEVLDAAHALSLQCRRNASVRKLSPEEQRQRAAERAAPPADPFAAIHKPVEPAEPALDKIPLEPEEDLLLMIRDHNPQLADWQRDLLTIVHEDAQYFIPQIETKIINEGWATFCHRETLNALGLPAALHLEFLVRHNQVIRPIPGDINPYHVGLKIWDSLAERLRAEHDEKTAREKLLAIRETERDASFLRRFLTEELIRELDLFEYVPKGNKLVISKVADEEGWRQVKDVLIRNVGMGAIPVIRVHDIDFGGARVLYLEQDHDGRDLNLHHAEHTLRHLYTLWGREVVLGCVIDDKQMLLGYNEEGFSTRPAN